MMTTIVVIVFFLIALFLMAFLVVEIGKNNVRKAQEYETLYNEIISYVEGLPVTSHNYDVILYKLKKLGQLKWKDKERTSVLTCNFMSKFAIERIKRHLNKKA